MAVNVMAEEAHGYVTIVNTQLVYI